MSRLLIVGGSDAGIAAARRARQLAPGLEVAVLLRDQFPNFSVCGLPFYISGEVPDWHALAHRSREELSASGIEILPDRTVTRVDPEDQRVQVAQSGGRADSLAYDALVLATGATPKASHIRGTGHPDVFSLRTIADGHRMRARLDQGGVERVVIVGAGYIGLEMADALVQREIQVVLVGGPPEVMPNLDRGLATLVREELQRHGVDVATGIVVGEIESRGPRLEVRGTGGFTREADVVLVGGGVEPDVALARDAGIATGVRGAIRVDCRMRTSIASVLAAGDCVETWHHVLQKPTYLPLGTTAHKQGRIAGETVAGGEAECQGSVGTQVVKVFDLAAAATGLRDDEAGAAGFDPVTADVVSWDHKAYYPGASRMHIRITGDAATGRLLGAQIVGHWQAQVAKRIDILAASLFHDATVASLCDLDLSYTPPLGSPWDAVQEAALAWLERVRRAGASGRH